jgi:hypothetical protein
VLVLFARHKNPPLTWTDDDGLQKRSRTGCIPGEDVARGATLIRDAVPGEPAVRVARFAGRLHVPGN